jgi:hypothetical protein
VILAALLEILSVLPAKNVVRTDETFTFKVRVRNASSETAKDVRLRAGANATGLVHGIEGPPDWKCDTTGPRFISAATCTTASWPPQAEAEFTVTIAAAQPSAMTYRVGASIRATGVPSRKLETNLALMPSSSQAELSMGARRLDDERAAFDARNDGPAEATSVMVVIENAALATGEGWTCSATAQGVACTRPSMAAGTVSTIEARGSASTKMSAQVRAELNLEDQPRDNAARP